MRIGAIISELLYKHDSVVLPGFGEFYTKYTPARFIPEAGKVDPPMKTIAFNPGKTEGDTPLINFLVEKQGFDSSQANDYLKGFAGEMFQQFEVGKTVELERVGVFSKDESGGILFNPETSINYLNIPLGDVAEPPRKSAEADLRAAASEERPSQGRWPGEEEPRDVLQAEPVEDAEPEKIITGYTTPMVESSLPETGWKKEGVNAIPEVPPIVITKDRTSTESTEISSMYNRPASAAPEPQKTEQPAEKSVPVANFPKTTETDYHKTHRFEKETTTMETTNKSRMPWFLRWVAFFIIPLLIILMVLALNFNYFFNIDREYMAQSDFARTVGIAAETPELTETAAGTGVAPATTTPATTTPATTTPATTTPASTTPAAAAPAVTTPATTTRPAQQPAPARVAGQTTYYVVVGSFPDKGNADKLVATLRAQGASNASIFMQTGFNYHRVCYGFYSDRAEAEKVLEMVKANINPDAWILER